MRSYGSCCFIFSVLILIFPQESLLDAGEIQAGDPLKIDIVTPADSFSGRANIIDGASVYAADFKQTCDMSDAKIDRLPEDRYYIGKWLTPRRRIRLSVAVGLRGESSGCELTVDIRDGVYQRVNRSVTLVPRKQFEDWRRNAEDAEREVTDLSEYPVTLFALNGNASEAPLRIAGIPTGTFNGFGHGDIFEGRSANGVRFTYECIGALKPGQRYNAGWIDPQERLEVLIPVSGRKDRYYPCEAATEVKEDFYVKSRRSENPESSAAAES